MIEIFKETQEKLNALVDCVKEKLEYAEKEIPFFIAGGSVFAAINNSKYNDIDVYFYNEVDFKKLVPLIEMSAVHITENAVTFINQADSKRDFIPLDFSLVEPLTSKTYNENLIDYKYSGDIQLIKFKFGTPIEIMNGFDLNCSCCAVRSDYSIIIGDNFSPVIHINERNLKSDILYRYEKYIQHKGSLDPDQKELKRILTYFITHPNLKIEASYGVNPRLVSTVFMLIDYYLNRCYSIEIHQFIHDSICDYNSSEKRIEIFSNLNIKPNNSCDELKLCVFLKTYVERSKENFIFSKEDERLQLKFAEYFI